MEMEVNMSALEKCQFGKEVLELPQELVEHAAVFNEVFSQETWEKTLTPQNRAYLSKFLPKFQTNDGAEKQETVARLFSGETFKFGNPLQQFHENLKSGLYSPDIAKYASLCRKAKQQEYLNQQQRYYTRLLKDVLVSRQKILEHAGKLPPDEALRLEKPTGPPEEDMITKRVRKKYKSILREVRVECGEVDTSSDEDSPRPSSSHQLAYTPHRRPLYSEMPMETPSPSIVSTLSRYPTVNGDIGEGTSSYNHVPEPFEVTDDDYFEILQRHKRRKFDMEDHPDLDTKGITLQDVILRTQAIKRPIMRPAAVTSDSDGAVPQNALKKKVKERKKKIKHMQQETPVMSDAIPSLPPSPPIGNNEEDESAVAALEAIRQEQEDLPELNIEIEKVPSKRNFGQYQSFFSLLRDMIIESGDGRITTAKLEEKVREWQDSPASMLNPWFMAQPQNWMECVLSAVKFLSGDVLGLSIENFIPLLDYKERAQQWKWIGQGRDSDEQLAPLCKHWLDNRNDMSVEAVEAREGSPPPPRMRTSYTVHATTDEEKMVFRLQERKRFEFPHKAFTYRLHSYESVVGPVKGVYTKDNAMNKAREHTLLISDRPAYVTILTLVRDAAARLPNGEGTRADICELLKDSMYLAPGVTDSQINTVVSGALDRLHYEKDPCVKYDVNRKLWIYLHRNREENEFERIHQAQGAAAKAKKALQKPKTPKTKTKEPSTPTTPVTTTPTSLPDGLSLEMPCPTQLAAAAQSPKIPGGASPKGVMLSPRVQQMNQKVVFPQNVRALSQKGSTSVAGLLQQAQQQQQQLQQQQQQQQQHQQQQQIRVSTPEVGQPGSPKVIQGGLQTLKQVSGTQQVVGQRLAMFNQGSGKPVALTFVQPASPVTASKPLAFSLVQSQKSGADGQNAQIILSQDGQPVTTTGPASSTSAIGSPKVTMTQISAQSSKPGTPPVGTAVTKPMMARLMQHMSSPQVMSVGNILTNAMAAAQKQGANLQGATIKIQGVGGKPAGGKPLPGKPLSGKPLSGKPLSGKPLSGKPLSGKPLSGKPLSGKPLSGKPLTISGSSSQIQTAQTAAPKLTVVSQAGNSIVSSVSSDALLNSGVNVTSGVISQILQQGLTAQQNKISGAQINMVSPNVLTTTSGQKLVAPGQGGIVVTQVAPAGFSLKPGAGSKLVTSSQQGGAVPTQIIMQPSQAGARMITPLTASGGKPGQNIQLLKTVISQPGGKPAQTTFLITQAGVQPSVKPGGPGTPPPRGKSPPSTKSKQGPVFARIITPPPGMGQTSGIRIATVSSQGQLIAPPNVNVIQSVAKMEENGPAKTGD